MINIADLQLHYICNVCKNIFVRFFRLTVHKDGPNKGRQFYGCPKGINSTCRFFKWADEDDAGNHENTDWSNSTARGRGNKAPSRAPQKGSAPKRPKVGTKRKCGICGIEGNV